MEKFVSILDFFVHPTLKYNKEEHLKARILIGLLFFTLLYDILHITLYSLIEYTIAIYGLIFIFIITIFNLGYYFKFGRTQFVINLFILGGFAPFVLFIATGGGIYSPTIPWLVAVSLIGFLFGNRLSGFLWAGLSLFTIIFFAILAYLKIEVPFMFPLKYLYWHFTICFFGVSVYILIIILIYDTINKNITNNIQIAHDDVVYKSFVIANQRNEILDSINYAKEIQQAILPSQQIIKQIFPQSFVLFKPKDIVSGDFYFFHQDFEHMYLAVADCTGHGVPGALLSMLGIAFLKDIISKNLHANSALILNELRIVIKSSLQQSGKINTPQDGMDISFCSINVATLEMSFAGAYQPVWIFRNNNEMESDNECMKIKGDGMPIGVFHNETPFHEHKIQLQPNDNLYIFSDGFASQFNFDNTEKFGAKRLHALLNEICRYEIEYQYNNLVESLALWQGKTEQIDDILLIGVRINI